MSNLIVPEGRAQEMDPRRFLQMQQQALAQEMAMARAARITALASAYYEQTGLKAEECKLVERVLNVRGQVIIEWTFEKKIPDQEGTQEISKEELAAPGTPLSPDNPAPEENPKVGNEPDPENCVSPHPDPEVENTQA
jgi:hypothetical protein